MSEKTFNHLTYEERWHIYALKQSHKSFSEIASALSRHVSTIRREITRNTGKRGYRPDQAHEIAQERRYAANAIPHKLQGLMLTTVLEKLHEGWSPQQIGGWMNRHEKGSISHQAIYNFIHKHQRLGQDLYKWLRHKGKTYKRGKSEMRGCIKNRMDIDQRPACVDAKSRYGDWEGDTIIGKNHQQAVLVLTERKSKYTLTAKLAKNTANEAKNAMIKLLLPMQNLVHTITVDNGKEFAKHADVARDLGAQIFFTKPYSSWQKGLVEHTNGLIREYIPKGSCFKHLTQQKLNEIQNKLNNRPRYVLNFLKPNEIMKTLNHNSKNALQS